MGGCSFGRKAPFETTSFSGEPYVRGGDDGVLNISPFNNTETISSYLAFTTFTEARSSCRYKHHESDFELCTMHNGSFHLNISLATTI